MDIVKSNIERIGGSVEISTRVGQGTTVKLKIPLPLQAKSACVCSPDNYRYLQEFLHQESGIVLEAEKHYLLEARLLGLAREHGVATLNDFCSLLRASRDASLKQNVIDALTTNETYFFREPEHYDALRTILAARDRHPPRFWSAASSTGQEAYSLAMVLLEMRLTDAEILGTDLCSRVLDRARAGIFSRLEMTRGLPASYAATYFHNIGPQWCINDEVKRLVRFKHFDLRSPKQHLGRFDAVFCRNVLIYFDLPTKRKIIDDIHHTLLPGGYLFLGSTESDLPVSDLYQRRSIGNATVYVAR
jgi:chemotaxis protein methyltransferase CheR